MEPIKTSPTVVAVTCASLVNTLVGVTMIGAQSHPEQSSLQTVTGEVSVVEGEFHMAKNSQGEDTLDVVDKSYVITNQAGETVRLKLTDHTRIEKRVNPGDRIEAKVSQDGHTLSVTAIQ
ncbi:MAG TPA: hypothetical protein VEI50_00095 [Nitrospiraceae bacterium]|nr:hypothetical protein [Nitrospiraceae bacterium]